MALSRHTYLTVGWRRSDAREVARTRHMPREPKPGDAWRRSPDTEHPIARKGRAADVDPV